MLFEQIMQNESKTRVGMQIFPKMFVILNNFMYFCTR